MKETGQKEKQSTKYVIEAKFALDGVVEKHDVIGAIFGQTEGLFPKEFELRELQKSGKIGRIDIDLKSENDRTTGTITVPSNLDKAETAVIAAAIETIDRIGPCEAKVTIEGIVDVRVDKREKIIQRAKEIMRDWTVRETQDIDKLLAEVSKGEQRIQPVQYGKEKLTATPDISALDTLIVVEGRADVINLLKAGYSGVIALEGVKVPKAIIELSKRKEVIAFLDGDRGGDLILKELMQVARPRYVARAPRGKEVEELTPEEIKEALSKKVSLEEPKKVSMEEPKKVSLEEPALPSAVPPPSAVPLPSAVREIAGGLRGTLEAVMLRGDGGLVDRVPVSEMVERLKGSRDVEVVVFDGIVTVRLLEAAREKGVKVLVGERIADGVKAPPEIQIRNLAEVL